MTEEGVKPCPVCKAPMEETPQDYVAKLEDGREVTLEDVPMWACDQCGYSEVEDDVVATIEDMLEHMDEMLDDAAEGDD